jgi:hypothetical protein
MSSKNQLQEYFQKRNLSVPIYRTFRVGGPPHDPTWTCNVTLPTGEIYGSREFKNKKEAEMDAAQIVLKSGLLEGRLSIIPTPSFSTEFLLREPVNIITALLIDVENQPKALNTYFSEKRLYCIDTHGFISHGHPLQKKIESSPFFSLCHLHVIPSTRPNGADIGMAVECGKMLVEKKYSIYVIVSNDNFAEALRDCLESNSGDGIQAFTCRSIEYAIELLNRIFS